MTVCQSQICERYVAGQLNADDELSFIEHLDGCAVCCAALEAAAGDQAEWSSAKDLLAFSKKEFNRHGLSSADDANEGSAALRHSLTFLAPSDDPRAIGRIGSYDVLGLLGRGGMGIVLKGFDRPLNRNVAIKVLDPAAAAVGAARERFAREARAMAAISHEHVVPIYAVDVHAGLPYFVMEYVAGGSLKARLRARGAFDALSVVRIGLQVAQSLAAAHSQGLVHRDIKPGNILIDSGTERVRVADFGLARVANDVTCTRSGAVSGTPHYMAPEQVRGEPCDAQSDLFSLGCVMYALCTGHPPFRAETVYGVMQRVLHDEPRSIVEQNAAIPAWLEQFVLRLLPKDKPNRFGSAREIVEELTAELAFLQNPTLVPKPARKWMSLTAAHRKKERRRYLLAGSIVCVVSVVAAIAQRQPAETSTEASDPPVQAAVEAAPSTVPLWLSDGTAQAQDDARAVHRKWYAPAEPRVRDTWSDDVAKVRRTVAALSSDQDGRSQ